MARLLGPAVWDQLGLVDTVRAMTSIEIESLREVLASAVGPVEGVVVCGLRVLPPAGPESPWDLPHDPSVPSAVSIDPQSWAPFVTRFRARVGTTAYVAVPSSSHTTASQPSLSSPAGGSAASSRRSW